MEGYIIIMTTVPYEDVGKKIAEVLLSKNLVPCMNIIPSVRSIYKWKGKINDERELICIMKARGALFERINDEIRANHPYECPEILALPILAGFKPYLDWIYENSTG